VRRDESGIEPRGTRFLPTDDALDAEWDERSRIREFHPTR
jgi:hypothetical protein